MHVNSRLVRITRDRVALINVGKADIGWLVYVE
jgi:hypothetical protein